MCPFTMFRLPFPQAFVRRIVTSFLSIDIYITDPPVHDTGSLHIFVVLYHFNKSLGETINDGIGLVGR